MERYSDRILSFDLPAACPVPTLVAFSFGAFPGGYGGANIAVTREVRRDGDTLRAHVDRIMKELPNAEKRLESVDSREGEVGRRPAVYTWLRWATESGAIEQTIVHVSTDPSEPNGVPCVTTFTSTVDANGDAEKARMAFAQMLRSVRFA
jgi:hypothetical protein